MIARNAGIRSSWTGRRAGVSPTGDRPLLSYGDVSTLSLHAMETDALGRGGAVMSTVREHRRQGAALRHFGVGPGKGAVGRTNARMSELHAAWARSSWVKRTPRSASGSGPRELMSTVCATSTGCGRCRSGPALGRNVASMAVRFGFRRTGLNAARRCALSCCATECTRGLFHRPLSPAWARCRGRHKRLPTSWGCGSCAFRSGAGLTEANVLRVIDSTIGSAGGGCFLSD